MFVIDPELFDRFFSLDDETIETIKEISNKKPEDIFHVFANKERCLVIEDKVIVDHAKHVYNLIMSVKSRDNDLIRNAVVQLKMSVEGNPALKEYIENC